MTEQRPSRGSVRPWGSAAALLAACAATLLGVVRGLDPSVILYRAAAAAGFSGFVVALAAAVWSRLSKRFTV